MAHGVDLQALEPADLDQLWLDVQAEVSRRVTIDNAPDQIREISQQVVAALGIADGDPWDAKMRTRGGYPKGRIVTHEGFRYRSEIDNNVWEPGEGPQTWRWWSNLDDQPGEGEWDPNGHDYQTGDEFTYNDVRYRVVQAHRSQPGWTPDAVPALYTPVA